jgi:hypothetical protein
MRRSRLFILVLILAALLAGVAFAGFRIYLGSDLAVVRFAGRLSELYGAVVQVDSLDLGMDNTTLSGVRFFEVGDSPGAEPWLAADSVKADLSFVNLAFDQSQMTEIEVNRPTVTLRFNKDGHLLTRLPTRQTHEEPLPALAIHQGIIRLQQEGQKEFVANQIDAVLTLQNDRLAMNGTISDPYWGEWKTDGHFDFERRIGRLHLENAGTHITQEKLRGLPFVAPPIWDEVQLDGDSPVDFSFSHDFTTNRTQYTVDLHPVRTKVFVTAINLQADNAHGIVRIENGTITLKDVHGTSADGEITTTSELRCRQEPKEMDFYIGVSHLDLRKLPNTWRLPRQAVGRLSGTAELQVVVKNHRARTFGHGEGLVQEGYFAGLPVKDLKILLSADGNGLHFKPQLSNPPAKISGK